MARFPHFNRYKNHLRTIAQKRRRGEVAQLLRGLKQQPTSLFNVKAYEMTETILNNNALTAMAQRAAPQVLNAIKAASARTGVDFAYLLEKAAAESSFKPDAKARTSSATGLYQFIESTWLGMVKNHGHKYGLGQYADAIDNRNRVADPAQRKEILELRKNPEKAALLAAEFARENQNHLERHVGGKIGRTELYFAHFMGASGAAGFLNAMKDSPLTPAADLFPQAARANRNVFYDSRTGQPRTLAGVYEFFDRKFGDGSTDPATSPAHPDRKPGSGAALHAGNQPRNDYQLRQQRQALSLLEQKAQAEPVYTALRPRPDAEAARWSWQREAAPAHPTSGRTVPARTAPPRTAPPLSPPAPAYVRDPVAVMTMAQLTPPARSRYND